MMAAPTPPYLPTSERVAVAWLGQRVTGLGEGMVATTLPSSAAAWSDAGFVQVQALPSGSPDIDLPQLRRPILQIDCWATHTDGSGAVTGKPPWNEANRLVELIRAATEEQSYGQAVTLPPAYLGARVLAAYFTTEPVRIPGDPSGYAHFSFDLALDWVRA